MVSMRQPQLNVHSLAEDGAMNNDVDVFK